MKSAALSLPLVIALAASLGGCVTLLPKEAPAQLYSFGPPAADAPAQFADVRVTTHFPSAAQGDGILTMTADQAADLAGARWVSPAVLMFEAQARSALVAGRGAAGSLDLVIDVLRFETDYDQGPGQAPTVRIEAAFTFSDPGGHKKLSRRFVAVRLASDNRVGAIVAAYDAAVVELFKDMNALEAEAQPS